MSERDPLLDVLRQAFQIEVDGYVFYQMAGEKARTAAVRELLARLAADERQHQAYLKEIIRFYDVKGTTAFAIPLRTPTLLALSRKVLPPGLGSEADEAELEGAVLSVGMQLETNAIAAYTEAAGAADDGNVKGFYRFLADWETQHLAALRSLDAALRGGPGQRPG